jgi:hypothetical protein
VSLFCSVNPFPAISFRLLAFTRALQFGNITAAGYSQTLQAAPLFPRNQAVTDPLPRYKAAAHLHNMGDDSMATRVMATCARMQYARAPQLNVLCALGSIVAAQGTQHDLIAHAPSPAVFAHGLHALRAASFFGIKQPNASHSSPAPNILAMTLKQFGSAAR